MKLGAGPIRDQVELPPAVRAAGWKLIEPASPNTQSADTHSPDTQSDGGSGQELQATSPQGERYRLKRKPSYLGEEEFRAHIHLHAFVHSAGGPVSAPPGLEQPLQIKGDLFEIHRWIEGRPLDRTAADSERAGEALARLHDAARDFPWPPNPQLHREPRDRFGKAKFYRKFLQAALVPDVPPWEDELYRHLEQARERLSAMPRYASQPLHGDPTLDNALLDSRGCWWIDLDDAHLGPAESDLAWLMVNAAGMAEQQGGTDLLKVRDGWRTDLAIALWTGYHRNRESLSLEALECWLSGSLVCALVDCFFDGSRSLIPRPQLDLEGERTLSLIDDLPALLEHLR